MRMRYGIVMAITTLGFLWADEFRDFRFVSDCITGRLYLVHVHTYDKRRSYYDLITVKKHLWACPFNDRHTLRGYFTYTEDTANKFYFQTILHKKNLKTTQRLLIKPVWNV